MRVSVSLFLLLVCATGSSAQPMVSEGLIAYWPLDGTGADASGNGHDGILFGPTAAPGRLGIPGAALSFDGADDYIDVGNNGALKPQLPVTIAAWVKPAGSTVIIFNNDFAHDVYRGVFVHIFNSRLAVSFGDGGLPGPQNRRTKASTSTFQVGQWYHLAMVIRGATDMDIYVNNIPDGGTYTGTGESLIYSNNPGNIGRWDAGVLDPPLHAQGTLDEIYFFDRELSPYEISMLYDQPVSVQTSSWGRIKSLYQ